MEIVEKTILNGSHREILKLAVDTLEYWGVSTASVCRILRLSADELVSGYQSASGIEKSLILTNEQLNRSRLVLELSIVVNATFENPTNRKRFLHLASPLFSGRTPLDILENDGTHALREAIFQLGAQSRWVW